jgi:hypothetical protein
MPLGLEQRHSPVHNTSSVVRQGVVRSPAAGLRGAVATPGGVAADPTRGIQMPIFGYMTAAEAVDEGFTHHGIKVGKPIEVPS